MNYQGIITLGIGLLFFCSTAIAANVEGIDWQDVDTQAVRAGTYEESQRFIQVEDYRLVRLVPSDLVARHDERADSTQTTITLPLPNGEQETFEYWEVEAMEPELQNWMRAQGYDLQTFAGRSLDNPDNTLRMDWGGPQGWHASVVGPHGSFYIDPLWKDSTEYYASYSRDELNTADHESWQCGADHLEENSLRTTNAETREESGESAARTAGVLRTYRLANAATGEYTQFHGGTVASAQAAIVTAINRVNQVFERDLSIRLILVGNNNTVVFTNSLLDPYTNSNGGAMLSQNQTTLDNRIGSANYDIGHVFSTGGGGVAVLESPCNNSVKAQGVTGLPNPTGDSFFIDFVAHEMGHQFGAQHTWNSASCGLGQRSATTAYEPGSGTTIMAYAGICGPTDNLQSNSDDYFHYASINEILNFTRNGQAGDCDAPVNVGGNPTAPTVDAGTNVTIPANTPFELTALNGNDPDAGSNLTYLWEQYDLGPATPITTGDTGQGPIIRSSRPTSSPTRSIPPVANVLNGSNTSSRRGEILPTTNRTLTFRVSAFDNDPDGGRVGTDTRTLTVTTVGSGLFAVTSPNGGETLGSTATVTWNTGLTNGPPVSAANVDIFFSGDAGANFSPILLGTPNDGSQLVTFPAGNTSLGRIKIRGSNNVFYDISNANFTVNSAAAATVNIGNAAVTEGDAGTTTLSFNVTLSAAQAGTTTVMYNTADGSARVGDNDYVGVAGGVLNIPGGSTTGTINITVNGDTAEEPNETMTVTLTSANNGVAVGTPATGTGTIRDDDTAAAPPPPAAGDDDDDGDSGGGGGGGGAGFGLLLLGLLMLPLRLLALPKQ